MKPHELPMFKRFFAGNDPDPSLIGNGKFIRFYANLAEESNEEAANLVGKMMDHAHYFASLARHNLTEDRAGFEKISARYDSLARLMSTAAIAVSVYLPHTMLHLRLNHFGDQSLRRLHKFIASLAHAHDETDCVNLLESELDITTCDDCGEYEYSDNMHGAYMGNSDICRRCIDDNYTYLDRYDAYVCSDDIRTALDEDGDETEIHRGDEYFRYNGRLDQYVHVDYEEEEPEPEIIRGYHSSKHRQYPLDDEWTNQNKRYLGVELEVDCSARHQEKASLLNDAINNGVIGNKVFFERDGSVPTGFEIISQPMSLPAQRQLWSWLNNKELVRHLKSHNTTNCGLHVHVSRQGLTPLQVAKIVAFVNSPDNEPLIRAIARRYAEGYCRIKEKKLGKAHASEDRYEAVNVTGEKTLEFRIFKGSLKYESVIAAIEFANAMVEFTRPFGDCSAQNLKTDAFMEFINQKLTNETKVLRAYIANRLETA